MNKRERLAIKSIAWMLRGLWWLWLGLGLLLYFGSGVIYVMDHLSWSNLPFWDNLWVLVRAQFVGWLDLPNVFGKVLAVTAALWLCVKILTLVSGCLRSRRMSDTNHEGTGIDELDALDQFNVEEDMYD